MAEGPFPSIRSVSYTGFKFAVEQPKLLWNNRASRMSELLISLDLRGLVSGRTILARHEVKEQALSPGQDGCG